MNIKFVPVGHADTWEGKINKKKCRISIVGSNGTRKDMKDAACILRPKFCYARIVLSHNSIDYLLSSNELASKEDLRLTRYLITPQRKSYLFHDWATFDSMRKRRLSSENKRNQLRLAPKYTQERHAIFTTRYVRNRLIRDQRFGVSKESKR